MPKPKKQFSRSSIDLDKVNRVWADVWVRDLSVGDTVADFGLIESVDWDIKGPILTNVAGVRRRFDPSVVVRAFVKG